MSNIQQLEQYMDYMQGRVSDSTLLQYAYDLKRYFRQTDGNSMTPEFAQRYVDGLTKEGKAPSTVSSRAHAIMSFFRWKKMDVRLDCPSIHVKMPSYLKPREIQVVIKACTTQLEVTLVVMLYDTAVRISELLNLLLEDVDWDNKTITVVRKGGRQTEVNVSDKALVELKRWLAVRKGSSEKVFLDLDYYTAWGIIKRIGKRAGIDTIHPHIFRHSRAIQMLRAGTPMNVVSQHLGHKSIKTTIDIYGQFMTPDLREQIAPW
jgi:integrase